MCYKFHLLALQCEKIIPKKMQVGEGLQGKILKYRLGKVDTIDVTVWEM